LYLNINFGQLVELMKAPFNDVRVLKSERLLPLPISAEVADEEDRLVHTYAMSAPNLLLTGASRDPRALSTSG
jgi:hypothetical protein